MNQDDNNSTNSTLLSGLKSIKLEIWLLIILIILMIVAIIYVYKNYQITATANVNVDGLADALAPKLFAKLVPDLSELFAGGGAPAVA